MSFWLGGVVLASLGAGAPLGQLDAQAAFSAHRDRILGTSFDLAVSGDEESGIVATAAALDEIARLDRMLTGWRDDSELAALNSSTRFQASPELFALIAYGEALRAQTGGIFSPRLGLLTRGGSADPLLAAAIANAPVKLDREHLLIERPQEVEFDLDAYAKGYIIDRALLAARRAAPNANGMLLNVGGDIAAFGVADDGAAWRANVAAPGESDNAKPMTVVPLHNAALAMSGGGARDITTQDGASLSHLFNPKRAQFAPPRMGAAVIAPTAMEADALATAYALMSARDALSHADIADVGLRLFGGNTDAANATWSAAENTVACQAAPSLPQNFRLDVSFEIPEISVGNYEKPYVSIWISDADRQLVRALLVLGDRARWREENYIWWRRYERLDVPGIQAIARPSRAPGHYTVTWDGRDQAGALAPQGAYTLNIEVAREHGSHTIRTIPLALGADAVDGSAAAQDELGAVAAHYGPGQ